MKPGLPIPQPDKNCSFVVVAVKNGCVFVGAVGAVAVVVLVVVAVVATCIVGLLVFVSQT